MPDLSLDFAAWQDYADWWDEESVRARQRLSVDDETIAQARQAFGRIGSSTVGAAYAATLEARRAAGQRLGTTAEHVAAHIRRDLETYAAGDADGGRMLST